MANHKFGARYTCFDCGTSFYDMNKPEPLCPKCGKNQKKAPKKHSVKAPRAPVAVEDFETEEEAGADEGLDEFPVRNQDEESFDPNSDRLTVDEMPDPDV